MVKFALREDGERLLSCPMVSCKHDIEQFQTLLVSRIWLAYSMLSRSE